MVGIKEQQRDVNIGLGLEEEEHYNRTCLREAKECWERRLEPGFMHTLLSKIFRPHYNRDLVVKKRGGTKAPRLG